MSTNNKTLSEIAEQKNLDEDSYSKLLNVYVTEVKKQEQAEKERQRQFLMEKAFSYSYTDIIFPYHMYLGKFESNNEDYQLTTLKTFNRRRMYLIWLYYEKFDKMLTDEERDKRDFAEFTMFKWNFGMKALSALGFTLTFLRNRFRPRNILLDIVLLYASANCFVQSYVLGVHYAWPHYKDQAKKMLKSKQRVNIEEDNTLLDDFKIKYYKRDVSISKYLI